MTRRNSAFCRTRSIAVLMVFSGACSSVGGTVTGSAGNAGNGQTSAGVGGIAANGATATGPGGALPSMAAPIGPAMGGATATAGGASASSGSPSGGMSAGSVAGTGSSTGGIDGNASGSSGNGGTIANGGNDGLGGAGGSGDGGTSDGGGAGGNGGGGDGASEPNSPGCGTPITRPDRNVQQTMEVGGTTRYYLLDVPESADNETPLMLIFGLHGFDMNNVAVKDLYDFTERASGQAITVLPQGEGPPPGDVSHWGDGVLESTWSANQANYDFIEGLIVSLGERYCLDRSRVFIVGFSMGAFFTNTIACEHGEWFRGFAPIAGGGPTACGSDVQAAIMVQHGTEDPIVELSSGEETRDTWVAQNGCSQSSTPSFDGCQSYADCAPDKPVVWCTAAFDHYIPENVTANIWSFFSGL